MARRLLENGDDRLLNNGDYRLLEPVLVVGTGATETDTANGGTPWAVVTIAANRSHETDRTFRGDPFVQWIVFGNRADETDTARPGTADNPLADPHPTLATLERVSVLIADRQSALVLERRSLVLLEPL